MIHFDFDDRYQDEYVVGSAMSRRESVVMSVVVHVLIGVALLLAPALPMFQTSAEELELMQELQRRQRPPEENRTFVFVQPKVDFQAPRPPERGEDSDMDRLARARERSANPVNPLPFARGNSSERTEAADAARARGPEVPKPPETAAPPAPDRELARPLPESNNGLTLPREAVQPPRVAGGALGEALRNLQKYVQKESFDNPGGGGGQFGPFIQFDTKGVEFGPWIRRFVAQVKRNWDVPYAAMAMRGHVVLQFNVHKDGRITDVALVGPSNVEGFNNAAQNAILASNPTEPLPPEYPADRAFFTVTFYYNEEPPRH